MQLFRLYYNTPGILTQVVSSNKIFYSPDFTHLAGGGSTQQVYDGSQGSVSLTILPTDKGVFTQVDATHWQVNYHGGADHDVIAFANAAAIHTTDFVFV